MGSSRKFKRPFISKKIRKLSAGECKICNEKEYTLLDTHRIKNGKDGGKYTYNNVVVLCSNCHRKEHAGIISILGWVESTGGRLLHIIDENGNENFL